MVDTMGNEIEKMVCVVVFRENAIKVDRLVVRRSKCTSKKKRKVKPHLHNLSYEMTLAPNDNDIYSTPKQRPTCWQPHRPRRSTVVKRKQQKRDQTKPYNTSDKTKKQLLRTVSVAEVSRPSESPSPGAPFPQPLIYVTMYGSDGTAIDGALCRQTPYAHPDDTVIDISRTMLSSHILAVWRETGQMFNAKSTDELLRFFNNWKAQQQATHKTTPVAPPPKPLPGQISQEVKEFIEYVPIVMTPAEEQEEKQEDQDCAYRRASVRALKSGGFVAPDYFFPSTWGGAPIIDRPSSRRHLEPMPDLIPQTQSFYDRTIVDSVHDPFSVCCNCTVMRAMMPYGWRCDECKKWNAIYNPVRPRPDVSPAFALPWKKLTDDEMSTIRMSVHNVETCDQCRINKDDCTSGS
jgi:hypothetical protein